MPSATAGKVGAPYRIDKGEKVTFSVSPSQTATSTVDDIRFNTRTRKFEYQLRKTDGSRHPEWVPQEHLMLAYKDANHTPVPRETSTGLRLNEGPDDEPRREDPVHAEAESDNVLERRPGHIYHSFKASDHARVHYGDVYHGSKAASDLIRGQNSTKTQIGIDTPASAQEQEPEEERPSPELLSSGSVANQGFNDPIHTHAQTITHNHRAKPTADDFIGARQHQTVTADSGYQSGIPTNGISIGDCDVVDEDSMSVVTDGQPSTLPKHERETLEAHFARDLFQRVNAEVLDRYTEDAKKLVDLLYQYSVLIGKGAFSPGQRGAASFVRHGRKRISKHVRIQMQTDNQGPYRDTSSGLSLTEKMAMWGITRENHLSTWKEEPGPDSSDTGSSDPDSHVLLTYAELREFLLESAEYEWLLRQLSLGCDFLDQDSPWLQVRRQVVKSIDALPRRRKRSKILTMKILLPWQPRDFMYEQYGVLEDIPALSSVITISGASENGYAATCRTYVQRMWPEHGLKALDCIQAAIRSNEPVTTHEEGDSMLLVSLEQERTTVKVVGDALFLTEVAETLMWISTACRASSESERIQLARMEVEALTTSEFDVILVATLSLDQVRKEEAEHSVIPLATCWHQMFRNPVVAYGYPIPPRTSGEKGLELSVDLMVSLAQVSWAVVYSGVLMLKGFSTLLTPALKIGESIAWHLTVDQQGERLSYNTGVKQSCLRRIDDAIFPGARHFVGWSENVDFLAGSPTIDYGNIDWARGSRVFPGVQLMPELSVTAGKYLNIGAKIMRGNRNIPESFKSENYMRDMDRATRYKVVLSDFTTRKHWLLDGASAILHLCRAWLSKEQTEWAPHDMAEKIWSSPDTPGPSASFNTLTSRRNRILELYVSDYKKKSTATSGLESFPAQSGVDPSIEPEWYLFQHQAHYFHHWLEQIHDRMVFARTAPGIDLIRKGTNVIGYEFKDILRGDSPVEPSLKELGVAAKAWLPYAEDVYAIHIHGANFGDLLKPTLSPSESSLGTLQPLQAPISQDSLIAPLSVLKRGIDKFDRTKNCAQISQSTFLCNVGAYFGPCGCGTHRTFARCKAVVKELNRKCKCNPEAPTANRLPTIFDNHRKAAIIIGSEPNVLVKSPAAQNTSSKRKVGQEEAEIERDLLSPPNHSASDSGYHSGRALRSQASSSTAESSLPDDFKFRGAASSEPSSRKLTKRRRA